jgi:hypothetical protein
LAAPTTETPQRKEQLGTAPNEPGAVLFGHERCPKLYQKAATPMKMLTKAHCLSDGNKAVRYACRRAYGGAEWLHTDDAAQGHQAIYGYSGEFKLCNA